MAAVSVQRSVPDNFSRRQEKLSRLEWTPPICDCAFMRSTPRGFAPLQKQRRNHRSYVWTEALSGMVFVPAQKLSGIIWTPLRYVTLHFRDRRSTASLCYRNLAEITVLMREQKPYPVCFSCRRKSCPVLCEQSIRRVHTEHVTTTTRNLPSWQSQGTDECCDSWLVLSPDRSFLGGSFPTGKQAQAPNDDKWNPLQTGNKGKT